MRYRTHSNSVEKFGRFPSFKGSDLMPTGGTYYGRELRKVPLSYLIHMWNNSDLQAISYSSSINATSYVTPEWRVKLANYIYNRRRLWKSSEAFRKMREVINAN